MATKADIPANKEPKKKTVTKKAAPKEPVVAEDITQRVVKPSSPKMREVQMTDVVEVKSCVYGMLKWKSPSIGMIVWDNFGESNYLTVANLFEMRNRDRSFFEKNWICIEGANASAVLDFLQVSRFYKGIVATEDYDELLFGDADEAKIRIEKLLPAVKETIARRAYALISEGRLDSRRMIEAVEETTGFDLSE